MDPPIYDDNESVNDYERRVSKYVIQLKKEKYDTVLDFINNLLKLSKDIKYTSVTDFKGIFENVITKDREYNIKTILEYIPKFKELMGLKIELKKDKNDDNKYILKPGYEIYIITKIVNNIGYSLKRRKGKTGKSYTIVIK